MLFKGRKNHISLTCEEVINQYSDTVYKVALNMMRNESDAQDIYQEVFLRYVKNEKKFESFEHLKAWLIRVTINCCNTMFSEKNKKASSELIVDVPYFDKQQHEITYYVQQLDEKYRIAVHLFYYEQYSSKEIAHLLNEKEATIKTRLSRARAILKEKWEEQSDVR